MAAIRCVFMSGGLFPRAKEVLVAEASLKPNLGMICFQLFHHERACRIRPHVALE